MKLVFQEAKQKTSSILLSLPIANIRTGVSEAIHSPVCSSI